MPLKVVRRRSTGALTITGTVAGQRIQRRAASNSRALAEEEAAILEAEILRTGWHGERRGARTLTEAMLAYCEAEPRPQGTLDRLRRIRRALGDKITLAEIDQSTVTLLGKTVLRPGAAGANASPRGDRAPPRGADQRGPARMVRPPPLRNAGGRRRPNSPHDPGRGRAADRRRLPSLTAVAGFPAWHWRAAE